MSIHKSLRSKARLRRHRNVLSRSERIEKLKQEERWAESSSVFGLPKVKNLRHVRASKKKEKEQPAEAVAAEATPEAASEAAPAEGSKPDEGEKKKKKGK